MKIPDKEVFKTMRTIALMKPSIEKMTEFFNDNVLEGRVQRIVEDEMKNCPCVVKEM